MQISTAFPATKLSSHDHRRPPSIEPSRKPAKPAASAMVRSTISPGELTSPLLALVDRAIVTIAATTPLPDDVLGHFVGISALVRSICFHEGKLLEQGLMRVAQANADLMVLSHGIRLPIVPAALDALSANHWDRLEGLCFDATARTRQSYAPDLVVVNRLQRTALILDLKRSLASYGESTRLDELKTRMMATALILPDWLYKEHKRLTVDTVGVAIIDGMSRTSRHDDGIWSLSEVDALLEINGAAAAMADLRTMFATKVHRLLDAEIHAALETSRRRRGPGRLRKTAANTSIATVDLDALETMIDKAGDHGIYDHMEARSTAAAQSPRRIKVGFAQARSGG